MQNSELAQKAKAIRRTILELIFQAKASHVGCSLSVVDILTTLYFGVMKVNPSNSKMPERDRLILSKGHAVTALYATLAEKGFFSREELNSYGKDGTRLASHVVMNAVPGIETSGGSGGHGLSLGVGMALAARAAQNQARVFVVSGDGELEEGSVWEAALSAQAHNLDNLILVIDRNFLQDGQDGNTTEQILKLEPLDQKFESFGWEVESVDGHDFEQLLEALKRRSYKPRVIIAKTMKGKGVSFMEGKAEWHGKSPDQEQYEQALKELS